MVEQVVRLTVEPDGQRRATGGIQEHCADDDRSQPERSPARWDMSGFRAATASGSGWWKPMRMPTPSRRTSWARWCSRWCRSLRRCAASTDSRSTAIPGRRWLQMAAGFGAQCLPVLDGHQPLNRWQVEPASRA